MYTTFFIREHFRRSPGEFSLDVSQRSFFTSSRVVTGHYFVHVTVVYIWFPVQALCPFPSFWRPFPLCIGYPEMRRAVHVRRSVLCERTAVIAPRSTLKSSGERTRGMRAKPL